MSERQLAIEIFKLTEELFRSSDIQNEFEEWLSERKEKESEQVRS